MAQSQYQEQPSEIQETIESVEESPGKDEDLHVSLNVAKDIESFSSQNHKTPFTSSRKKRRTISPGKRLAIALGVVACIFSMSLVIFGVTTYNTHDSYAEYIPAEEYYQDDTQDILMEDLSVAEFMVNDQLIRLPAYFGNIREQGFSLRSNSSIERLDPGQTVTVEVKTTSENYGNVTLNLILVNPTDSVQGIDEAVVIGYQLDQSDYSAYLPQWISVNDDYYYLMDKLSDSNGKWVMEGSQDDATLTIAFPPAEEGNDIWSLTFDLLDGRIQEITGQYLPSSITE